MKQLITEMKQLAIITILILVAYQVTVGIVEADSVQRAVIEQAMTLLSNI